mmetsp:Transcript_12461/g.29701  ORF Transcript_12461/g.29701 Transcript_12461/m.29701 type:complete len:205 (+) Transcript_12461:31-645(+)
MRALRRWVGSLGSGRRTEVQKVYVASAPDVAPDDEAPAAIEADSSPLRKSAGPSEAWSKASRPEEVQVEDVEECQSGEASPTSGLSAPTQQPVATFGEEMRTGYQSRAEDRERWLTSLAGQEEPAPSASPLPVELGAPLKRMTAKELLAQTSGSRSPSALRDPADVFNEQLKRWNMQMKTQDVVDEHRPWNGNVRMTWSINMGR